MNQQLLNDRRQLVLTMVAAWRWQLGDNPRAEEQFLRTLRAGP
ncbi:hypothetical protein ACPW96_15765 [Micromonospora sp. DT81.3]